MYYGAFINKSVAGRNDRDQLWVGESLVECLVDPSVCASLNGSWSWSTVVLVRSPIWLNPAKATL